MRIHSGTLNREQERILFDAGFTYYEIKTFDRARTPDGKMQPPINLDTDAWQEVLRERRARVDKIQKEHIKEHGTPLRREWQSRRFNLFYLQKDKSDPFDWLKKAYKRIHHLSGKSLKQAAKRLQNFPSAKQYKVQASFD